MTSAICFILCVFFVSLAHSSVIPSEQQDLSPWFAQNFGPVGTRKLLLDPELVRAESSPIRITVGSGQFRSVQEAINSIPKTNTKRVIISVGPGTYREKVSINHPFVTLMGDPTNSPTLLFDGTNTRFKGTRASATLTVEADYFMGVNFIIKNTAPKPTVKEGGQAVALFVQGENAAFYSCKLSGFQDMLCDDGRNHFYRDCYIEGAVDFIFGRGRSIFMTTHIHVVANKNGAFITEQENASPGPKQNGGFSFVHCIVSGVGRNAYLGRALQPYSTVVFSYSDIGDIVKPEGWFTEPTFDDRNTYYGEYKNTGVGSRLEMRQHIKKLSESDVARFLNLDFINASQWLLPPPPYRLI